ncbi:MAG: hypothetical protein HOE69_03355 [Euryarchaeota archaeon]|jgi:hypothetical protein|nr:hypothetical protein [Euryarchaeota archaeon]
MGKLWAMFFLSILLVSVMNFYAVVREPDIVEIADLHEHIRESVKIRGELTSYVRDPYDSGADRIDLLVEDGYNVSEVRWTETGLLPPIGTLIEVVGEVTEWNGRIWISATGAGSIQWDKDWIPKVHNINLTGVSHDPAQFDGDLISLVGYSGDVLEGNVTRQISSLMDSPSYSSADHVISVAIEGRLDQSYEAGSKIMVTGWVRWSERDFKWQLQTHATQILVLNAAGAKRLSWSADSTTWSYDIGSLVTIEGEANNESGQWWIMGPGEGNKLCMLPHENDTSGEIGDYSGRLVWEEERVQLCLDHGQVTNLINPTGDAGGPTTPLSDLVRDPNAYRNQTLDLVGWIDSPISPDYNKGYLADGPDYFSRSTKIRIKLEGVRSEWLEAGTKVNVSATLIWDSVDARLLLEVHSISIWENEVIPVVTLSWIEGFDDWQWDINKLVKINGVVTEENGTLWINREGSQLGERLCLMSDGTELAAQNASGASPLEWQGRLSTSENVIEREVQLCLDRR